MDAHYTTRKQQLLAECQVAPEIFHAVMPRLETFISPFAQSPPHILNFKLPVEISTQPQPLQDCFLHP